MAASLAAQAETFAAELASVLAGTLRSRAPVRVTGSDGRFLLEPAQDVIARHSGEDVLRLEIRYSCALDRRGEHLAVDKSHVKVYVVGEREPLVRFEFERVPPGRTPAAHIQVHAQSHALGWVWGRTALRPAPESRLQSLHLPVGGSRFRPCLEDVLEMLIWHFELDVEDGWRDALERGRATWRRAQLAAAIRDDVEAARTILRELDEAG